MPSLLLHVCCGVCAGAAVQKLKEEGFLVAGLFYNPNIAPEAEYRKRLDASRQAAKLLDIELIEERYDNDVWMDRVKGLELEPEGAKRCLICYRMRLEYTQQIAQKLGYAYFTTTLSTGPHKKADLINAIGKDIDAVNFLAYDFKKENGFKKSMELAKASRIYRQNYCGCLYSKRK